jgi:hypothetical protein
VAKTLVLDVEGLSEDHIAALETFFEKFKAGALEHGDLHFGKDWTDDALHEVIDLSFYMTFMILERRRK